MTTKTQTSESKGKEDAASESVIHPQKFIYQKGVASGNPDLTQGDRYIVTVERKFATHWTCREVDAPADRVPKTFTVIPHKDLITYGSEPSAVVEPEVRVDINSCTAQELIKACPGVGVAAHYIIDRRPKTGYQSLAYLKQLNGDLPIDWVTFNTRISFTTIPALVK